MRPAAVIAPAIVCLGLVAGLPAESPKTTFRYPRVYGPTGRPYGPTQAHYQYMKQYGRSWHGYGGETVQVPTGTYSYWQGRFGPAYSYVANSYYLSPYHHHHCAPYGGLSFSYGYGSVTGPPAFYGPAYSHIPMSPLAIQAHPEFIGKNPFDNPVLKDTLRENLERWGEELILQSKPQTVERPIRESTPAARLTSLKAQRHGDFWFRKGEYLKAYSRYKRAVADADDRAEAHFRLAYSLIALGYYQRAVRQIKRGLRIDPQWPVTGESLSEVFGPDNLLEKSLTISETTAWVREDIRDPDRLFLIGVLLHFDDDDRAGQLFDAALRLSGGGEHLLAFLRTDQPAGPGESPDALPRPTPNKAAPPRPPVPPKEPAESRPESAPLLPPLPKP